MSKWQVIECGETGNCRHAFSVYDRSNLDAANVFYVDHYGLDEARRRAEAEAKWLNENAEPWKVLEVELHCTATHRFRVTNTKTKDYAVVFYVNRLGFDFARAEAERLCRILNERDASK